MRPRHGGVGSRLAAGLALLALACAPDAATPGRPNVILVVVDTLRADRLPSYGWSRPTAPFLDELAHRGALFERVIAASSWTKTSMASLMTARDPVSLGVKREVDTLPAGATTLAGALRAAGWRTLGLNTNPWLGEPFGFANGFDVYESANRAKARVVNARALELVARERGPFFLFLHYMDVHAPYRPDPRWVEGSPPRLPHGEVIDDSRLEELYRKDGFAAPGVPERVERLYEAGIRGLDEALRELFTALEARGALRDAIVVVTADHGEAFREHGTTEHGWNLYPEVIRVPLLLVAPGRVPAGLRIEAQVPSIAIAPTILALLGLAPPEAFEAVSLWPLDGLADRTAVPAVGLTTTLPDRDYVAVVSRDHLYVRERLTGAAELYDLRADPLAHRDLGPADPAAAPLAALLSGREEGQPGKATDLDPETVKHLEELGYLTPPRLGPTGGRVRPPPARGPQ